MHPDLITFIAVATFPVVLWLSRRELRLQIGYVALLSGTVWISIGAFFDFLEHVPAVANRFDFLLSPQFNFAVSLVFVAPGAALTAYGMVTWLPTVSGMASEIKRRRMAEESLIRSEERARVLVQHAPEAITLINADTGEYIDANPAAERLHGYTREELLDGLSPWSLSPEKQPDGRPSPQVALEHLEKAKAGMLPRFEWMHINANGKEQPCEVALVQLPDEKDCLIRASVIDISQRKATEEILKRAQRMEALAILSGGAAHDFNNQLAIIRGSAELMEDVSDANAELVNSILQATDKGAHLTRRLLTYARKNPGTKETVDVDTVVCRLAKDLQRTLGQGIDVICKSDEKLLLANVDPSHLEDALLNLALNTRDAMPNGGTLMFVSNRVAMRHDHPLADKTDDTQQYVKITVSDTGEGIKKEHLDKVHRTILHHKIKAGRLRFGPFVRRWFRQRDGWFYGHIIYSRGWNVD